MLDLVANHAAHCSATDCAAGAAAGQNGARHSANRGADGGVLVSCAHTGAAP